MASIKTAYGAETTLTVTNLHSLASSATTGWQSDVIDNTSDLYLDALVQVVLDFANTAPGSDKAAYVYAYGGLSTVYTNPVTGTQGTITLTTIVTTQQNIKLLGVLAYNTADEIVESQPMSVAQAFGGILPPKWGLVILNYSGAALAGSGNTVKWRGVYATQA